MSTTYVHHLNLPSQNILLTIFGHRQLPTAQTINIRFRPNNSSPYERLATVPIAMLTSLCGTMRTHLADPANLHHGLLLASGNRKTYQLAITFLERHWASLQDPSVHISLSDPPTSVRGHMRLCKVARDWDCAVLKTFAGTRSRRSRSGLE